MQAQVQGCIVVLGGLSLCRQLGKDLQIYSLCLRLLSGQIQRSGGALRGRGAVVRCGGLVELIQQRPLCASSIQMNSNETFLSLQLIASRSSLRPQTASVTSHTSCLRLLKDYVVTPMSQLVR